VNPSQVIGMIAINLVISVAIPGISLLGHVGGLVTGALLTAALIYSPARLPAQRRRLWQVGAVCGAGGRAGRPGAGPVSPDPDVHLSGPVR